MACSGSNADFVDNVGEAGQPACSTRSKKFEKCRLNIKDLSIQISRF
jgi:hypothetical protein